MFAPLVRFTRETEERRETGAFYRFKSDEPSSSGKRRNEGWVKAPGKRSVNRLVVGSGGPSEPLPSALSRRTMAAWSA